MSKALRRFTFVIAALAVGVLAAVVFVVPQAASAHPLGNFSINHYDRIVVSEDGVELFRVLEMAEIAAFQERQRMDTDGDGEVSDAEGAAWAATTVERLRGGMRLEVDGVVRDLAPQSHELTFPEGQGGLKVLRLTATYHAVLPESWQEARPMVRFSDENYPDRIGWREIIVRAGPGVDIPERNVPDTDISGELLNYPEELLESPLEVRSAWFRPEPGIGQAAYHNTRAVRGNPDSALGRYADLIAAESLTLPVILVTLIAAAGFGALHALSPGHGKTIVAAYLVGSRGTAKHALLLGLTVTVTHTSSVYLLGFVTLYFSDYILPEDVYPWLEIGSAVLIMIMGVALFVGRLRASGLLGDGMRWLRARLPRRRPAEAARRAPGLALAGGEGAVAAVPVHARTAVHDAGWQMASASAAVAGAHSAGGVTPLHEEHAHENEHTHDDDHTHNNDDHTHEDGGHWHSGDHAHDQGDAGEHRHGWGPAHSHAIPGQDGEPITWRRLIGLGIFGGMIPCPSAIVVMLSAIALHRVGYGLILILFFSLGLAGVLTGIGFAVVYAQAISRRVPALARLVERVNSGGPVMQFAVRAFPTAAALFVIAAGIVLLLRAMA